MPVVNDLQTNLTVSQIIKGCDFSRRLSELRFLFEKQNFLLLPNFLDRFLVNTFHSLIHKTQGTTSYSSEKTDDSKGLVFSQNAELNLSVNYVMNQPRLLRFLQLITGLEDIGSFVGYIYRTSFKDDRALEWHQDLTEHRLVAISINLSLQPYTGGEFALREVISQNELLRYSNTGVGDLLLVKLSPHLEHCTTKPMGHASRLTLAGWGCKFPKASNESLY